MLKDLVPKSLSDIYTLRGHNMTAIRHWWSFGLLILCVIASTWLTFSVKDRPLLNPQQEALNPDSFAEQVSFTNFDKMGKPANKLDTPILIHRPYQNKTFIEKPLITVYVSHQSPWTIIAQQGELKNGITQLDLAGHVHMHQAMSPSNPELTLLTEAVTLYPNMRTAMTNLPVNVREPGTTLNATGVEADFNKGTLNLKSNMRGVYEIHP